MSSPNSPVQTTQLPSSEGPEARGRRPHGLGVWSSELRYGDPAEIPTAAAELERLGYTALWVPDMGGPLFEDLERILNSTENVTVGTGVANIWLHQATEVAAWRANLPESHRQRLLLGLGVGHRDLMGAIYTRPLTAMRDYLDVLETEGVPLDTVLIAALGPRMLELAGTRTAGTLPYLVTPQHSAMARSALGEAALAVVQGVILNSDAEHALAKASEAIELYGGLSNYTANWERLGFNAAQVTAKSEEFLRAVFAVGTAGDVLVRLNQHRSAGADHVAISAIPDEGETMPWRAWSQLAPALQETSQQAPLA